MIEGALRPVPRPMGPNARFDHAILAGKKAAEKASERLQLAARTAAQCAFDALSFTSSLPDPASGKLDNS